MKKILTILVLGLALSATSCSKYFDLERPSQYPWQSAAEFEMAVRAPYLYYVGAAWSNPIGALTNRFGESDLARFTGKTGDSYFYAYWQRLYKTLVLENSKELEGGFEYLYYMSTACNAALELLETAEANGTDPFPDMTDADKALVSRSKGELLFMRAFTYWNLARTWCPPYDSNGSNDSKHIVVYRNFEKDSDVLKNGKMSTVKEVYDYIVKDLKDAIAVLPEEYYTGDNNKRMRANKYAAEALLARVLFYMGQFGEAKTYIDNVIAKTDLYALDTDLVAPFNKTSSSPTSKEVIWEIVYSDASDRYDRNPGIMQYAAYNGHANKMCGYAAFSLSYYGMEKVGWLDADHKLTAEAENDLRFQNLYKYHPGNDSYPEPAIYIFKYFRGATPTENGRRAPRPLIRLSDLYLMRAEINFLNKDYTNATKDVNVVRERAGLADLATVTEEDIENERIKELAGENGDRIYWLVALHKDIPLGDRKTDGTEGTVISYPYSDYYYQIPLLEKQNNSAYSE